ncbi:hypothetical protein CR513_33242, partial [Mucuna pruriens]
MMFLGYDSTSAYKLYNSISKKIVLNKDFTVDESKGWWWETTIESDKIQPYRPQRTRQPPEKFGDYSSIPNFVMTEEEDMMHLALLAETKPMSFKQSKNLNGRQQWKKS